MSAGVERLELAAMLAPEFRRVSAVAKRRRVHLVRDGEVVGVATLGEVQDGLLRAHAIEVETDEGVRPREVPCQRCGKPVLVATIGPIPTTCHDDVGGCSRQVACPCGCAAKPPRGAFEARVVARRNGQPWRCRRSAIVASQADSPPRPPATAHMRTGTLEERSGRFYGRLRLADGTRSSRMAVPDGMTREQAKAWVAEKQAEYDREHRR